MGRTFKGGTPYSIDVRRLNETFPTPSLTEGRVIGHAQLEEVLGAAKGSQRYYGVVNSWIAQLKTAHAIYIVWQPSVGIEVLDPANLLTHAETKTRQKIRQTGRAVNIFAWVDRTRLNTSGQQILDHRNRVFGVMRDAMHMAKKDLAAVATLSPIQSLPKPQATESPTRPPMELPPRQSLPKPDFGSGKDKKKDDDSSERIN